MNMEIINEILNTVSIKLIIFLIGAIFMFLTTFIFIKYVDLNDIYIKIKTEAIIWVVCLILIFIATISFMIWI